MKRLFHHILALLLIALLSACGAAPQPAKSGSAGSIKTVIKPSALAVGQNVAGIQLTITIPIGVSPPLLTGGAVDTAATVEITSTAPQSNTLPGVAFTPATATAAGKLTIVAMNIAGFTQTDRITIHLNVAVDSFPSETDFALLSFAAYDINGATVTGLDPTITATIQY